MAGGSRSTRSQSRALKSTRPQLETINEGLEGSAKSQLDAINKGIQNHPVYYTMPPTEDYIFMNIRFADSESALALATHEKQLFMGEDAEYRSWARLKNFPNVVGKESEVDLIMQNKATADERVVVGKEKMREMPLQYPFEVFRLTKTPVDLKTFIRYVYLEARLVEDVFLDDLMAHTVTVLREGLDAIKQEYDRRGGAEAIPQMTGPTDLDFKSPSVADPSQEAAAQGPQSPSSERSNFHVSRRPIAYPRSRVSYSAPRPRSKHSHPIEDIAASARSLSEDLGRLSMEPTFERPDNPRASRERERKHKRKHTSDLLEDMDEVVHLRYKQNKRNRYRVRVEAELDKLDQLEKETEKEIVGLLRGKSKKVYDQYLVEGWTPRVHGRSGSFVAEREERDTRRSRRPDTHGSRGRDESRGRRGSSGRGASRRGEESGRRSEGYRREEHTRRRDHRRRGDGGRSRVGDSDHV